MSRTIGHFAPWLLITLVGGLIALTLVPTLSGYVPLPMVIALLALVVGLAVSILMHNRRPCERCIASMPLDAGRVASGYSLRFRVAHLFERKLFAVGYLAAVVGFSFLSVHPVGRYGWAVVQASLVYLLFVYVTHQRLQPWCPHCKTGGAEITAPSAPTPVSSNH